MAHNYHEGKHIDISPYGRTTNAGQASWSRLFARLQIQPEDLNKYSFYMINSHGTEQLYFDRWKDIPKSSDLLIEGTKISYGLTADEFMALLILSGFSPSWYDVDKTKSATGHLGHMYVRPHTPFSQIAQLDGSSKIISSHYKLGALGRFTHRVEVRHCVDLALGILRFDSGGKYMVIVISKSPSEKNYPSLVELIR
jgi:hypothetical protein